MSLNIRARFLIACIAAASAACLMPGVAPAAITSFGETGNGGNGDAKFDAITAIDVDSAGNIYVLDVTAKRVKKFNKDGTYVRSLTLVTSSSWCGGGGCDPGTVSVANGVNGIGFSVLPTGDAFVIRDSFNRVMKFNWGGYVAGTLTELTGQFNGWNSTGGSNIVATDTHFIVTNSLNWNSGPFLQRCPITSGVGVECLSSSDLRTDGSEGSLLTQTNSIARIGDSILVVGVRQVMNSGSFGYLIKYSGSDLGFQAQLANSTQNVNNGSMSWVYSSVAGGSDGSFVSVGSWGGATKFTAAATQQATFGASSYYGPGAGWSTDQCRQPIGSTTPWSAYTQAGYSVNYADAAVADDGTTVIADRSNDGNRLIVIDPQPIAWVKPLTRSSWSFDPGSGFSVPGATPITGEKVGFSADQSLAFGAIPSGYEWDLDNNGSYETTSTPANPVVEKAFATAGAKTVKVRVLSPGQPAAEGSASVTVYDSSVSLTGGGINVGSTSPYSNSYTLPGDTSSPRAGDTVNFTANGLVQCGKNDIAWDLDGNGSYETPGTQQIAKVFDQEGSFEIGVQVTHDGDRVDTVRGTVAVRRGARPAQGEPGISINGGAVYTNNPNVSLSVGWPFDTDSARVSNDGGFVNAQLFDAAPTFPWVLQTSGEERLPKTVYIRYGDQQYTDDIILDRTAPKIDKATGKGGKVASASRSAEPLSTSSAKKKPKTKTVTVKLTARDNASGVAATQITMVVKKAVAWVKVPTPKGAGIIYNKAQAVTLKLAKVPAATKYVYVRVGDKAGNASGWRKIKLK